MSDRVLGIDIGGSKIALALADRSGEIVQRREVPVLAERGAAQALERAIAGGQALAHGAGGLAGVGVATMGVTLEDRVLLAPNVPGWESLAIPAALRAAFPGVPLRIENDVKAATFAELRRGALRGIDTGMYVNLGTGLCVGIVVGGRIVRGIHGAAGEIGFNPRSPAEVAGAPAGAVPLEAARGGRALESAARTRFGATPAELFARTGEPAVDAFLDEFVVEIAFHLATLAIALDPERIALGAGMMRSAKAVLPRIAGYLARFTPWPVEVVAARFTTDAALVGAVALALEPMPTL